MGRIQPGHCDSEASTTVCHPQSPARHTSHLTPELWQVRANSSWGKPTFLTWMELQLHFTHNSPCYDIHPIFIQIKEKKLHFGPCLECFYLKDFILQHWQLSGIPCYKVVANFGIFPCGGHSIVRPVKTHGILFVDVLKEAEKYVRYWCIYPFDEPEGWRPYIWEKIQTFLIWWPDLWW